MQRATKAEKSGFGDRGGIANQYCANGGAANQGELKWQGRKYSWATADQQRTGNDEQDKDEPDQLKHFGLSPHKSDRTVSEFPFDPVAKRVGATRSLDFVSHALKEGEWLRILPLLKQKTNPIGAGHSSFYSSR
jgi:hypothetical protein